MVASAYAETIGDTPAEVAAALRGGVGATGQAGLGAERAVGLHRVAGALVQDHRQLVATGNKCGDLVGALRRGQQRDRLRGDPGRVLRQAERQHVLAAGRGEVAALAADLPRHALREGAALDVVAVAGVDHQAAAALGQRLLDQRALGVREHLLVAVEVHRRLDLLDQRTRGRRLLHGGRQQVELGGQRDGERVDLHRRRPGVARRHRLPERDVTAAAGGAGLADRLGDDGVDALRVQPVGGREAPVAADHDAQAEAEGVVVVRPHPGRRARPGPARGSAGPRGRRRTERRTGSSASTVSAVSRIMDASRWCESDTVGGASGLRPL